MAVTIGRMDDENRKRLRAIQAKMEGQHDQRLADVKSEYFATDAEGRANFRRWVEALDAVGSNPIDFMIGASSRINIYIQRS